MLLLAADALPPVAFDLGLSGWTPDPRAHRARPCAARAGVAADRPDHPQRRRRAAEEDAEVWDSGGRLVAQSRGSSRG